MGVFGIGKESSSRTSTETNIRTNQEDNRLVAGEGSTAIGTGGTLNQLAPGLVDFFRDGFRSVVQLAAREPVTGAGSAPVANFATPSQGVTGRPAGGLSTGAKIGIGAGIGGLLLVIVAVIRRPAR